MRVFNVKGEEIAMENCLAFSAMRHVAQLRNHDQIKLAEESAPNNLQEFEDRLIQLLDDLDNNIIFDPNCKKIKNINSLDYGTHRQILDNYSSSPIFSEQIISPYKFLKSVLESNTSLNGKDYYYLGVHRHGSILSKPEKNKIAVQCAAQIIWHFYKNTFPTIESMVLHLKNPNDKIFQFLEIYNFQSPRTFKNWIRSVFPIDENSRKCKKIKNENDFAEIWLQPDIIKANSVDFCKMRFVIECTTLIMKLLGYDLKDILNFPTISYFHCHLKFYLKKYVIDWVNEAYHGNGRLF